MESAGFTKSDLAKYPFLKQTAEYIRPLGIQIDNLESLGSDQILRRAEQRVTQAIMDVRVPKSFRSLDDEIISFPIALLIVIATENAFIMKRYALAEAKQASSDMMTLNETKEKILKIAKDFDWKILITAKGVEGSSLDFTVNFSDYLRNAAHLHDKKWKLINSVLADGNVYLSKKDVVRLLEEEIKRRIEKRLDVKLPKPPALLEQMADRVKKLATEVLGQMETDELPKIVVQSAFPPCVNALYAAASTNHQLSHIGRFTLTSFLLNIGMPPEAVNELFKTFSDYNERLTRYQIEHIAGDRGSGTKYTPPQCSVLQTHGVCKNADDLCRRIYHPLGYYRRKQGLSDKRSG
jgi:DNA primase large subunit